MEPWEALDLDDSNPSPFLRPCSRPKNSHHNTLKPTHQTTTTTTTNKIPFLDSQTLTLTPPSQFHQSPPPPAPAPSPRIIPGPAGAVQSAMLLKSQNHNNILSTGEDPIPTQEFIRRAVEESADNDEDFARHPWLFAVDFIRRQGGDDVAIGTPLSEIKNGINMDKVTQVVAIVKSCTPNGLGDLVVTLKDPTDTIDATIHHRVLTDGEFGKDISVGAVLILQKVAVFSPSRSVRYLNITLSNVVKVISKDSGPLLKENYPASTAKHAAPVVETCEKSWMPQKSFSLSQSRTKGIMNNLRQNSNERGSTHNDIEMEEQRAVAPVSSRDQITVGEKEPFLVRKNVASGRKRLAVGTDTTDNDQGFLEGEQSNPWTQAGGVQCSTAAENLVEVSNNQEKENTSRVKRQREPLISRGSLPQWTDEQLDELLL